MSPTPGRTEDGPKRHRLGEDGSLRDLLFGDDFASSVSPAGESELVFLEGNRLPARFRGLAERGGGTFSVAEIGFGTGLNFALCADLFSETVSTGTLEYVGLEGYPLSPETMRGAQERWPERLRPWAEAILGAWTRGERELRFRNVRLRLELGLFRDVLPALELPRPVDAWILDGFAPSKNPDAWSADLFAQVARLSAPGTTAATFTVAGQVRREMVRAGFSVRKAPGFGLKRSRLEAVLAGAGEARAVAAAGPAAPNAAAVSAHARAVAEALRQAVRAGDAARAERLLDELARDSAAPPARDAGPGTGAAPDSLLFLALRSPNPEELVRSLLRRGASADARNARGSTALVEAIRARLPGVERLLLEAGADPELPDGLGRSPGKWRELVRNGTRRK